ncbi:MAG: tetratricopeptide repeat protein [Planctomycetes bacterium]|nr:tetratricopeptide repeat protein [Planctomycetota bacterium]
MNAEKLVERAKMEAGRRNYPGAVEYFLQALTIDPGHREARRGAREAALKQYENAYPSGAARFLGGIGPRIALALTRDRRRRMEAIEKLLANDPRNRELGMRLGALAEAENLPLAAAAAYEGVSLGNPQDVESLKALGRVLHSQKLIDEAIAVMEKAVALAPRDAEVQRLRKDVAADGYARDAGFSGAKTTHDLLKDREHSRQLEKKGRIVRGADDLAAHAAEARAAAEADPGNPAAWAELGGAEAALRNYAAAEEAMQKACSLAPDDVSLRVRLGDIRIGREDRRMAELRARADAGDAAAKAEIPAAERRQLGILVEEFRYRVAKHPTDLAMRHSLAGYLERSGDLDGAIAEYQNSIKDPRRRPEALGGLGRCFLAKGLLDLAASQLEKAIEEAGAAAGDRSKSLLYDLATVKEKQGDVAKARECLARIYEVDISYQDVARRLEGLRKA